MRFRVAYLIPAVLAVLAPGHVFCQESNPFIPEQLSSRAVNRVLEQGTWGPTSAGSILLQRKGFSSWFNSQLVAPVSTFADQPLLNALGTTNTNVGPVQVQFFQNALYGLDQLRQRVAFALSKIWVVSQLELNNASALPPILRLFQQDAFGNYEQVMTDVTLNPAMGRYLNMVNNDKANSVQKTSPNENYAREIMQLFTLGLMQLNEDGSPVVDGNGFPLPAYTEATVAAVTKAFTGWTYAPMPGVTLRNHNPSNYLLPMVATEANHDATEKALFPGFTLPAGQGAAQDLKQTVHAIFMQSSLPPFVCAQLIKSLVTSNPSRAYVQRVSRVFVDNGQGVRGDLKAVIFAILTDPEARAGDDPNDLADPNYGHMREPVLFALNLLRGLNGAVSPTSSVANQLSSVGEQLLYAPSVFSYFSPSYRLNTGLGAPEFQIYSTQAASNRINLVYSAIYGGRFDVGTTFDISAFTAAAALPANLIPAIDTLFFHSAMSSSVKTAITQAMNAVVAPSDKAKAALYIALSSAEYQIIN